MNWSKIKFCRIKKIVKDMIFIFIITIVFYSRIKLAYSNDYNDSDKSSDLQNTSKSFEDLYSYPSSISVNDDDSFNNYQFFLHKNW